MDNWTQTLLSQYANSPTLTQLLENANYYIDPSPKLASFYENVVNILTAEGYGLDCWGRIVGVGRVLTLTTPEFFGWNESLPGVEPWNQGIWYGVAGSLTSNYSLSDEAYRLLILAKARANIWDGSIPGLNDILIGLFGQAFGNAHVQDNENMTLAFVFYAPLDPVSYAIVATSGVLPVPAGVAWTVTEP